MMIENIENEKDCCGSCDFCMFDNNGNAVCADDNSKHKYGDIISPRNSFQKEIRKRFVYVLHNIATKKSAFLL